MMRSPRQEELLATPRWAWLAEHLAAFYADPLTAADGCDAQEIAALRAVQPAIASPLIEWHALVGRRVAGVQDAPVPLSVLLRGGYAGDDTAGTPFWSENQGSWVIYALDDGTTALDDDSWTWDVSTSVISALRGAMLSELLVAASAGLADGPLGALAPGVRGGHIDDPTTAQFAGVLAAYEQLPASGTPFQPGRPRGNAEAVLRGEEHEGGGIDWVVATDAALRHLTEVLMIDIASGPYEFVVLFSDLSDRQQAALTVDGVASLDAWRVDLGDTAHLTMTSSRAGRVEFRFTTDDVSTTAGALIRAIPADLTDHAIVAHRPAAVADFTVDHPAGMTGFRLTD